MRRHRTTLPVFCLLFAGWGCVAAAGEVRPHPACFELLVQLPENAELPASLNLDGCSEQHAEQPVSRFLDLTRYERPRGAAGESRGTLSYERITGPEDQVIYRLLDNVAGTGMFSLLVSGRELETAEGRVLVDIDTRGLGDRCHLGSAWVGNTTGEDIVVGVSLTPAALPQVLAAPNHDMPHAERERQRIRHAFGDHLANTLTACPTCCLGEATYKLAGDGGCWQLMEITLDSLEPFNHAATATLYKLLQGSAERTPEGFVIPAESITSIQRAMVDAHREPTTTERAQFWLRQLGYYWLAPVDGIAGPRTQAAIRAWRAHRDTPAANDPSALTPEDANKLALEGLRYDGRRLHPLDETARDAAFSAFTERLKRAVDERDIEALISMTAPDIMLGFGGSGGHADLRNWLEHAEIAPDIWQQFEDMLPLGAVREGPDAYCFPYTGCLPTRLLAGLDPFTTVIVTAAQADLLTAPNDDATVVRPLDHDILEVADVPSAYGAAYLRVRDIEGNDGFVLRSKVRFVIGPRIQVNRTEHGWRIQSLVSGD